MIGCQSSVGRTTRQTNFAATLVSDVAVFCVAFQDTADIANIVQKTGDDEMGVVVRQDRRNQRPSAHYVVSRQCYQHRMFDIMIKGVAPANAFERKSGNGLNQLGQTRVG